MNSDFDLDNQWQREMRDKILVPQFYKKFAFEGRYILIDKGRFASILQKQLAADTIVQSRREKGVAVAIEEKIVRWPIKSNRPYSNFTLETYSCTVPGHERDGWMVYCEADFLLYCFASKGDLSLDCHLINMQELKKWFWQEHKRFQTFGPLLSSNASSGRKVPIADVYKSGVYAKHMIFNVE